MESTCESCAASYSSTHANGIEHFYCPSCEAREQITIPLHFMPFELPESYVPQSSGAQATYDR
jgi:hypothetical protein